MLQDQLELTCSRFKHIEKSSVDNRQGVGEQFKKLIKQQQNIANEKVNAVEQKYQCVKEINQGLEVCISLI